MGLALNHLQRQAIQQDPDWAGGRYLPQRPPRRGLALARQIGMLSYKSAPLFDERFGRNPNRNGEDPWALDDSGGGLIGGRFDIAGYLDHQGERFIDRFDANAYLAILRTMETWDPLHGHASPTEAFGGIRARLSFVGISSDWLFPPGVGARVCRIQFAPPVCRPNTARWTAITATTPSWPSRRSWPAACRNRTAILVPLTNAKDARISVPKTRETVLVHPVSKHLYAEGASLCAVGLAYKFGRITCRSIRGAAGKHALPQWGSIKVPSRSRDRRCRGRVGRRRDWRLPMLVELVRGGGAFYNPRNTCQRQSWYRLPVSTVLSREANGLLFVRERLNIDFHFEISRSTE